MKTEAIAAPLRSRTSVRMFMLAFAMLLLAGAVGISLLRNPTWGIAFLMAAVVSVYALWRLDYAIIAISAYMVLVPIPTYAEQFPFLPVHFIQSALPFMVGGLLFLRFLEQPRIAISPSANRYPSQYLQSLLITLYVAWVTFQSLRGFALGRTDYIGPEFSTAVVYLAIFPWMFLLRKENGPLKWSIILVALSVIVSVEYALFVGINFQNIIHFVTVRVLTRQAHFTIVTLPLAYALLLAMKGRTSKLLLLMAIFMQFLMVFLSQWRNLWVAHFLMILLFWTLYSFRSGYRMKNLALWTGAILALGGLFASLILGASYLFGVDLAAVLGRWRMVEGLQDASFQMRYWGARYMLDEAMDHWFLGHGAGAVTQIVPTRQLFNSIDVSFVLALFRGGLPQLVLLVGIYAVALRNAWLVYRHAAETLHKLLAAASMSALMGILFSALLTTNILTYRFIFFWVFPMALVHVLAGKLPGNGRHEWSHS